MTDFTQLGLSPTTLQAVIDTGYTTATPIQAQAIPVALAGATFWGSPRPARARRPPLPFR